MFRLNIHKKVHSHDCWGRYEDDSYIYAEIFKTKKAVVNRIEKLKSNETVSSVEQVKDITKEFVK